MHDQRPTGRELVGDLLIVAAGRRTTGGVVVHQDDRGHDGPVRPLQLPDVNRQPSAPRTDDSASPLQRAQSQQALQTQPAGGLA